MERENLLNGFKVRLLGQVMVGVAVALLWSQPADAQLSRASVSMGILEPGGVMRGTDTAYDPGRGVYLLVAGNGPVYGIFVNTAGQILTAPFVIWDGTGGHAHFPRAEYSPGIPGGGFLVAWHHAVGPLNYVFARTVTYPSGPASAVQLISGADQNGTWWETAPAISYSRTSGRFLVAWQTFSFGILGRFVDNGGTPFGAIIPIENPGGARDPSVAWNPATDEFGIASAGFSGNSAFASFRRVRASDGLTSPRTTFGFTPGTYATGIDVNIYSNNYVMVWGLGPGTHSAMFDAVGNQLTQPTFITGRLGFDQAMGFAFNVATGTFLAVSHDSGSAEVGAVEMTYNGMPSSVAQVVTNGARLGSFYPQVSDQAGTNVWSVVYSRDFQGATKQIVATSSSNGGTAIGGGGTTPPPSSPPPPTGSTGCTTPDPFVAIGGGTCVNGGWIPGGSAPTPPPSAPPPPPPPASGCSTPDPFASIGGGTCVNGGWIPGGGGGGGTTGGCTTPDPFAAIGGGRCVSGGWVPGAAAAGGCTTPDPFVSLGGGTCVDGGWRPGAGGGGGATSGGCTTPDPFAALGGGSCVSGGWVPGAGGGGGGAAGGCTTPDPFTSIGGGSCVGGGWVPAAAACGTPDPFVSIGGGTCVAGGWVPRG